MFNRRSIPYLIAGSITVFLFVFYVGYKAYQSHVEFEAFISESKKIQRSIDNTSSPKEGRSVFPTTNSTVSENPSPDNRFPYLNKPPTKVRFDDSSKSPLKLADIPPELRGHPNPDEVELVIQRVQTPDGQIHEMLVARGMELPEGASFPPSFFKPFSPLPPRKNATTKMTVRKEDIPEGEDITTYMDKLRIASDYGVSMEEAEKMLSSGQIRITEVDRSPVINLAELGIGEASSESFRGEADLDGTPKPGGQRGGVAASAGTGSSEDLPARSFESTPSPQNVADIEKQLTPQGIEAELTEGLSPERFDKAQRLIDQFGTAEGLRRLRATDPEAARQFEREGPRSGSPQPSEPPRDAPNGEESQR